jgi:hypothetical protein
MTSDALFPSGYMCRKLGNNGMSCQSPPNRSAGEMVLCHPDAYRFSLAHHHHASRCVEDGSEGTAPHAMSSFGQLVWLYIIQRNKHVVIGRAVSLQPLSGSASMPEMDSRLQRRELAPSG